MHDCPCPSQGTLRALLSPKISWKMVLFLSTNWAPGEAQAFLLPSPIPVSLLGFCSPDSAGSRPGDKGVVSALSKGAGTGAQPDPTKRHPGNSARPSSGLLSHPLETKNPLANKCFCTTTFPADEKLSPCDCPHRQTVKTAETHRVPASLTTGTAPIHSGLATCQALSRFGSRRPIESR